MTPIFRKDSQKFVAISQTVLARLRISTTLITPLVLVSVSILVLCGILMLKANSLQRDSRNRLSLEKVEPVLSKFRFKISKKGDFLTIEDVNGEKVALKADRFEDFDKYFEAKTRELTNSNLVGLLGSKDNTTAVLQIDHSLTYESIRPVFYALAQNKIHSVGFEVNALSFASKNLVKSNSAPHDKEHSK
jgi:hypothetical protein